MNTTTQKPDLYLCLDVGTTDEADAHAVPPEVASMHVRQLMVSALFDGGSWRRTWRAFESREAALAHQAANPTLVVIPLIADTILLVDLP